MSLTALAIAAVIALSLCACWSLPAPRRVPALLLASYAFALAIDVRLALLLAVTTLVSFLAVRATRDADETLRARWLAAALALDAIAIAAIGLEQRLVLAPGGRESGLLVASAPLVSARYAIGASFYLLQGAAFLHAARRDRAVATAPLRDVALLFAFFPKLLAGPIASPRRFLEQARRGGELPDRERFRRAAWWILSGVAAKCVLADRLGAFCNPVLDEPGRYEGVASIAACYLLPLQFAFDVSAYLLLARGLAGLLGFDLACAADAAPARPRWSRLWRGWYPEIARALDRDVAPPLAVRIGRSGLAFLAAAGLLGLWHHATPAFFAIGVYFGALALVVERTQARFTAEASRTGRRAAEIAGRVLLYHALAAGVLALRTESPVAAASLIGASARSAIRMLGSLGELGRGRGIVGELPLVFQEGQLIFPLGFVGIVALALLAARGRGIDVWLLERPRWQRWCAYIGTCLALLISGRFGPIPFFYFRF